MIKKSIEAKEKTGKTEVTELIKIETFNTYASNETFDTEIFKENVNNNLSKYNPSFNEDEETITVTIKGYDVIIDKEKGNIVDVLETDVEETGTEQGDGQQEINDTTQEPDLDTELPTVSISPNGGTRYVMPTTGQARLSATIISSKPDRSETIYEYAWSTSGTSTPTTWTTFSSAETIEKTDCTTENYYLWVKISDKKEKLETKIITSGAFVINPNTNTSSKITLTPSTTYVTNQNVVVSATYGEYLTQYKNITCTGTENVDYIKNETTSITVKTKGQTITASATDIMGNKIIETYKVDNIDKEPPTTTIPSVESTTNSITVSFAQTDSESGINSNTRQYAIKKTSDSIWGEWITDSNTTHIFTELTLDTSYDIKTQVKDLAGNGYTESDIKTIRTKNNKKPIITLSTTAVTNKNITATIAYPEFEGETKQYSYDGIEWNTYTDPLTIEKNKTIYTRSIDNSENEIGTTKVATLTVTNIDKTLPIINKVTASTEWTNTNKPITVEATDGEGSGIAEYAITTNTKKPTLWTSSTELNWTSTSTYDNGKYYAWVRDNAGNISKPKEVTVINIEKEAPTISVSNNITAEKSQTGTITIGDNDSGLSAGTYIVKYTWTTSQEVRAWAKIATITTITVEEGAKTGTTTVTKNDGTGTYYLHAQAQALKDLAGNASSPSSYGKFNIDNSPPTVTFTANGDTTYKKSQRTTVKVSDIGGSTVDNSSLKYIWTQSTTEPEESSFTRNFTSGKKVKKSDGTGDNWYLWILAKDKLGNTRITRSNEFYLDNTDPTETEPIATATENSITVNCTQTDDHSGINSSTIRYAIKKTSESIWGAWITDSNSTHTFTGLTPNTSYDVKTQVKDNAGNGYTTTSVKTITTEMLQNQ